MAQLVCALRRKIVWGDSFCAAAEYANAVSGELGNHRMVAESSLERYFHLLPKPMQADPFLATEGALLACLQQEHLRRVQGASSPGRPLFTPIHEELIAQWVVAMAKINRPVDKVTLVEHARIVLEQVTGVPCTSPLNKWYRNFLGRYPGLSERVCQNIKRQRLTAQAAEADIAHYFQLLSQFKDYPAHRIYAGDETGLDGEGELDQRLHEDGHFPLRPRRVQRDA
jgi:hypothetical protein